MLFYVLFTVNLSIILNNDQLDAHLLHFTVRLLNPLRVSVHRTATDWEDDTRCCINAIQPPDDEHITLETCRGFNKLNVK